MIYTDGDQSHQSALSINASRVNQKPDSCYLLSYTAALRLATLNRVFLFDRSACSISIRERIFSRIRIKLGRRWAVLSFSYVSLLVPCFGCSVIPWLACVQQDEVLNFISETSVFNKSRTGKIVSWSAYRIPENVVKGFVFISVIHSELKKEEMERY